jgi:hypothetical protein
MNGKKRPNDAEAVLDEWDVSTDRDCPVLADRVPFDRTIGRDRKGSLDGRLLVFPMVEAWPLGDPEQLVMKTK